MKFSLRLRAPGQDGALRSQPSLTTLRERAYNGRRRLATLLAALLTFAVGYHVIFGQNGLTAYEQKKQSSKALNAEVVQLTAENEALKGHVDRLASDPDAIERQAREQLHYTRPGEVIVALPPESARMKTAEDEERGALLPPWLRHLFTR